MFSNIFNSASLSPLTLSDKMGQFTWPYPGFSHVEVPAREDGNPPKLQKSPKNHLLKSAIYFHFFKRIFTQLTELMKGKILKKGIIT